MENLWRLSEGERAENVGRLLACNRPINAAGIEVSGLEALRSSPSLSKKQLRNQSMKGQGKKGGSGFGRHTAGTTGEPTQILLDRNELARMLGVRDYCFRHYGVKLGYREARLWGRAEAGVKSWLRNFVMNRRVFHPVGPKAEDEVEALLKWQPDYLYGYASLLLEAARILATMDIEFHPPKCVVCTAESILPAQKAYISRVFKAPVAEEYGSTEFDVIAFECTEGHRHLVNPWLIVENSEHECLVTDVSRQTQSLIKYQLGDSLSISTSSCQRLGNYQIIDCLEGRSLDRFFYITEHEKVHATIFPPLFEKYFFENNEIFGFTVVQVGLSEVNVLVDDLNQSRRKYLKYFIEKELKNILNVDINVSVILQGGEKIEGKRGYFKQRISVLS
ncbi:CoF synthetase [Marinobacter orientalis]|uniref:CoF synthetase n=1 Tax=Marinobacter orientalis TaxID=1928859 RepID=A0A7Y0RCN9_9GAMM|nr:CoF synthetase [Marinobacter orientalis]NMT63802.1 CoF synthetase [Marinobacter orientalis]TGX49911.1 CoF synthetase [Marinobacter orientalis]